MSTIVASVNDKDDSVKAALLKSLDDIGQHQTDLVLTTAANYLQTNPGVRPFPFLLLIP